MFGLGLITSRTSWCSVLYVHEPLVSWGRIGLTGECLGPAELFMGPTDRQISRSRDQEFCDGHSCTVRIVLSGYHGTRIPNSG
jgi:hypothetical protein